MTLYEAFVGELSKIAKEKRSSTETAARIGGGVGGAAVFGGLASEILGGYKYLRGGVRKRKTPKAHKYRKWGRRLQRGGLATMVPSVIATTLLQRRGRKK